MTKSKLISFFLRWGLVTALTSITVWLVGENPIHVFKILATSAFGSTANISYTIFFATPLLFTGTAVTLALEAGLFNIGGEGQLYMGTAATVAWAITAQHWLGTQPSTIAVAFTLIGGFVCAFLGGAFWGGIAGYLRAYRHTHEVIATIMLNFIAMAFVNWMILSFYKNPETQNIETVWIPESLRLNHLWLQVTKGTPIALLVAVGVLWALKKTWWGFKVRATGQNETAAGLAGISSKKMIFLSLALSGGIAGLVGFNQIYCYTYTFVDGFSPGFGFTGLAIALLARGSIPKLIFASLMFGALHKGALDLDLETDHITRDLSAVIQALILVSLSITTVGKLKPIRLLTKRNRTKKPALRETFH